MEKPASKLVELDTFIAELKNVRNVQGNVPVHVPAITFGDDAIRADRKARKAAEAAAKRDENV